MGFKEEALLSKTLEFLVPYIPFRPPSKVMLSIIKVEPLSIKIKLSSFEELSMILELLLDPINLTNLGNCWL